MGPSPYTSEASPAINSYEPSSHVSPKKYNERQTEGQFYGGYEPKSRARPSTPTASNGQDLNIEDILRKYNQNKEIRIDDSDSGTLKQLCKSKSGLVYKTYGSKYCSEPSEHWEGKYQQREESFYGSRTRQASKENVMKRAEEEAAKKIEEIERKARMKVLEKKNILSRNDGRDWRGLAKKGNYY